MLLRHPRVTGSLAFILIFAVTQGASADLIIGGEATMSIDLTAMSSPPGALTFTRFYGALDNEAATLTRDQMVTPTSPPPAGSPTSPNGLVFGVNPEMVTSPTGRYRQGTTLNYDPSNVLGSWSPSTVSGINVTGGEQIGLDGVVLSSVSESLGGGAFLIGDFALEYAPALAGGGSSGLVITNNFDIQNVPVFYIGDASIIATQQTLTITGDLLLSSVYASFFGGTAGSDVGSFSLSAYTSVPEPGSLALASLGMAALAAFRWWSRRPHGSRLED